MHDEAARGKHIWRWDAGKGVDDDGANISRA